MNVSHIKLLYAMLLRRLYGGHLWVKDSDGQWRDYATWERRQDDRA